MTISEERMPSADEARMMHPLAVALAIFAQPVIWLGFECLGVSDPGARLQAVLLLDTLAAVLWYA